MQINRYTFATAAGVMICLSALFAAGISSASTQSRTITLPPPTYGSSVTTSSGTYATLAMGHLSDPLNTFWQIFEEPSGSNSFTDETVALAVGTNGGLLLGANTATAFEVAARPSVKLTFTPVLEHQGKSSFSWVPVAPLSKATAAFSQRSGASIAIVGAASAATLVESPHLGANWHTLATLSTLGRNVSVAHCAPTAMTAATFDSTGDPMVGLACTKSSVLGLYRLAGGTWQPLSPSGAMVSGMTSVLYLTSNDGTAVGIVCVTLAGEEHLYEILDGTGAVKTSPLGVIHGELLTKGMGATPQGGVWITYSDDRRGVLGLLTSSSTARPKLVPNISSSVATLSIRQDGTIEALSLVDGGNALQVATLTTAKDPTWKTIKVDHLTIPYGAAG